MGILLKWFYMLSKRLYKKTSFVVLLLLVPTCVLLFSFIAKQNSGFLHIVLSQKDSDDELSSEIINELSSQDSLIRFTVIPSYKVAVEEVRNGLADEAWVFEADTSEKIKNFPKQSHVVSIFTKEQTVPIRLAREKLTGAMYKYCAKAYYLDYIKAHVSELNSVSENKLQLYFQNASVDESLFVYGNSSTIKDTENSNYLTSPIRGLLAILAVLCGMAATMYYKQDEIAGTFAFVKNSRKGAVAFGCVMTAVLHVSAVLCISLLISSLATNIVKEIISFLLYAVCCTTFCLLLGSIFTNLRTFSAIIPLIIVLFIGLCPVFLDFRNLNTIQLILPPTYFVNVLYDSKYLIYMVLYSIACIVLSLTIKTVKNIVKYR